MEWVLWDAEDGGVQGADEDICTYEGGNNRRVENV